MTQDVKPQIEKFKEVARQLECDEDEAAFEEKLKKIAPPPKATEQSEEDKPAD
jgi:hypothetical protein